MTIEAEPMKEDSWSLHEHVEDNQEEKYIKQQVFKLIKPLFLVITSAKCFLFAKRRDTIVNE